MICGEQVADFNKMLSTSRGPIRMIHPGGKDAPKPSEAGARRIPLSEVPRITPELYHTFFFRRKKLRNRSFCFEVIFVDKNYEIKNYEK